MTTTVDHIDDHQVTEYKGDVHVTGNVGMNARITIIDGNLLIDGDVADDAVIKLTQTPQIQTFQSSNFVMINHFNGNAKTNLRVTGKIGNNVSLSSNNSDLICGQIGTSCKLETYNGSITASHVGSYSSLKTYNGSVTVSGTVDQDAALRTYNGSVQAKHLEENTSAITYNGHVNITDPAPKSAKLKTYNGNIYDAGVKRKKIKPKYNVFSVVGDGAYISGSGRVFVNGREIDTTESNHPSRSYAGTTIGAVTGMTVFTVVTTIILMFTVVAAPVLLLVGAIVAAGLLGCICGSLVGNAIDIHHAKNQISHNNAPQKTPAAHSDQDTAYLHRKLSISNDANHGVVSTPTAKVDTTSGVAQKIPTPTAPLDTGNTVQVLPGNRSG